MTWFVNGGRHTKLGYAPSEESTIVGSEVSRRDECDHMVRSLPLCAEYLFMPQSLLTKREVDDVRRQ